MPGDIIQTKQGSEKAEAVIVLDNTDTVRLASSTSVCITTKRSYILERGIIHCKVMPKSAQDFRVKIEPASTEVRVLGTEFKVKVIRGEEDRMKGKELFVYAIITVLSGNVAVLPAHSEQFELAANVLAAFLGN